MVDAMAWRLIMARKTVKTKVWDRNVLKQKVREFLNEKGQADQMDVADKFHLYLQYACELLDEMCAEGIIAPVKSKRKK